MYTHMTKNRLRDIIESLYSRGRDISFYAVACGVRVQNRAGDTMVSPPGTNREVYHWLQGYRYGLREAEERDE